MEIFCTLSSFNVRSEKQTYTDFRVLGRAVPDLFPQIRPEPDFAGFGMANLPGAGAGFSN